MLKGGKVRTYGSQGSASLRLGVRLCMCAAGAAVGMLALSVIKGNNGLELSSVDPEFGHGRELAGNLSCSSSLNPVRDGKFETKGRHGNHRSSGALSKQPCRV